MKETAVGMMRKKTLSKQPLQWGIAVIVCCVAMHAQAGIVASWDFEEAVDGQYGVESISTSTSSVNGVVAEGFANNPLYVRGADGVGHGTGSGYLQVVNPGALLSGFTEFNVSFDARFGSSGPGATMAVMRYGVTQTAWNIYATSDGKLNVELYDTSNTKFVLNTANAAFFGDSTYHHYEIVWDGTFAQIKVDGAAQLLEDGSASIWTVDLGTIRDAGATGQLGIGGMIRDNSSYSQEFAGFLDNISISNTAAVPEPASVAMLLTGAAGLLFLRRRY